MTSFSAGPHIDGDYTMNGWVGINASVSGVQAIVSHQKKGVEVLITEV